MRDEDVVRPERGRAVSAPYPDPRCPECGYTMCELFDYTATGSPIAFTAIPNGKFQCYHCTPTASDGKDSECLVFIREVAACSLLLADDEREYDLIQRARALLATMEHEKAAQ